MELIILTDTGCEEACAREIERIAGARPAIAKGAVTMDADLATACRISYRSCTARRVLARIHPDTTLDALDAPAIPDGLLPEGCTFKAEGEVLTGVIATQELVETVGGWFQQATGRRVSLTAPDVVVVASMTDAVRVGIDISGPLSKRDWRIMLSNRSLKSTIAASAVVYAGIQLKDRVLDPLGDDGTLAIEAACILGGLSPRRHAKRLPFERFGTEWRKEEPQGTDITVFCDSLREMKAVRMNSKLAGVDIRSTRVPIDWADLKLEEGSVDRMLTHAPQSGKAVPEKRALQRIDDLFNQAAYLLTKKGTITCVTAKPEELHAAKRYGFKERDVRHVLMGKMPVTIATYGR